MTNSRRRGADYEREIAKQLREKHGMTARRGQQYSGANGDPDVICLELGCYHLELKRRKKQFPVAELYEAMRQSKRDARTGQIPVVIHRLDNEKSLATMDFDEWVKMARRGEDALD